MREESLHKLQKQTKLMALTKEQIKFAEQFVGKLKKHRNTSPLNRIGVIYTFQDKDSVNSEYDVGENMCYLLPYIKARFHLYYGLSKDNPLVKKLWKEATKDLGI